ncbi:hypothetical protein SYNTR_1132 [Candidatus Syntrophocurvum alkaliphilum]|uniref:Cytosolic protein n=1 Tax=Candidatus Syntrophocurvum alkaliphilum TaxID=2293317 RepID=A0A6I6DAG4_9FIRM|nr:DUF6125 family protein [Candidatus Syntrophocurvum alkaliphilum]QGT99725.1 hypothetical protein SYNTR_1132 [Candidatus Syntrophocurvum alkaliphilum]
MDNKVMRPEELEQKDLARLVIDMFHRITTHHVLWFKEVEHQKGFDKALEILDVAYSKSYSIQLKRLSKVLNFEVEEGIPKPLLEMPREKLIELIDALGVNWLANDGVWFQSVEFSTDMYDAKRCNDTCWTRFSPFEAWSIKRFLNLPEKAGIEGLKQALQFRLYSRVNVQSIIDESENAIVFQMNDCRVQSARKRQGLDDYPCKSAGVVEYTNFAKQVDSRIKTECIGCPPDEHPDEWFCAWRFTLEEEK